jgi:hypothetical protein
MRPILFEWVVVQSKGEDLVLTPNQYDVYKRQHSGVIRFKNFEINPAFVVQVRKEPVNELKNMYPCLKCQKTGKSLGEVCTNCAGSGVDTKNV